VIEERTGAEQPIAFSLDRARGAGLFLFSSPFAGFILLTQLAITVKEVALSPLHTTTLPGETATQRKLQQGNRSPKRHHLGTTVSTLLSTFNAWLDAMGCCSSSPFYYRRQEVKFNNPPSNEEFMLVCCRRRTTDPSLLSLLPYNVCASLPTSVLVITQELARKVTQIMDPVVGDEVVVVSGALKGQVGILKKKGPLQTTVEFSDGKTKAVAYSTLRKYVLADDAMEGNGKRPPLLSESILCFVL